MVQTQKMIFKLLENQSFSDISEDGNRLLIVEREGEFGKFQDLDNFIFQFNVSSKELKQVPEINFKCGKSPNFISNTGLFFYQTKPCDYAADYSLVVSDLNGKKQELFDSNLDEWITGSISSQYGDTLYFSRGPPVSGIYSIPIPNSIEKFDDSCSQVSNNIPIFITTDKDNYESGEIAQITGFVEEWAFRESISVNILNTHEEKVQSISLIPSSDGSFSQEISIDEFFDVNGTYIIQVETDDYYTAQKPIVVPEFGWLVLMVLTLSTFLIFVVQKMKIFKTIGYSFSRF